MYVIQSVRNELFKTVVPINIRFAGFLGVVVNIFSRYMSVYRAVYYANFSVFAKKKTVYNCVVTNFKFLSPN